MDTHKKTNLLKKFQTTNIVKLSIREYGYRSDLLRKCLLMYYKKAFFSSSLFIAMKLLIDSFNHSIHTNLFLLTKINTLSNSK